MLVDNISYKGFTHKICEDYSLSAEGEKSFIIVADGCSSAPYSEIGSMLLSHAAAHTIRNSSDEILSDINLFKDVVLKRVLQSIKDWMDSTYLYSTLLVCFPLKDDFIVYIFGDGVIATHSYKKEIQIHDITYKNNYPFYLAYEEDKEIETSYRQGLHYGWGDNKNLAVWDGIKRNEKWEFIKNFNLSQQMPYGHSAYKFPIKDFKTITLFTDGISSFINSTGKKQSCIELIPRFINYSKFKEEFVIKRAKNIIESLKKDTISYDHYDDFSMATIFNTQD